MEKNNKHKIYKPKRIENNSSLRTVTIFPGDRKVAGRFYFLGGIFNGRLHNTC